MASHEGNTLLLLPRERLVPPAYRNGAVPIAIPTNPSTPVSKTPLTPFVRWYTGPPVDSPPEDDTESPSAAKRRRRTLSSTSRYATSNSTPRQAGPPSSTTKPTVISITSSTPLSAVSTIPSPHPTYTDAAETFAATRLESLIPLPFLALASESRCNVILPPSSDPNRQPTRHTILFDAAHALIMHQSVFNSTAAPSSDGLRSQLDALTNIAGRQTKVILELESENAMLRTSAVRAGLGEVPQQQQRRMPLPTATLAATRKDGKRKKGREKARTAAAAAALTATEEDEHRSKEADKKKEEKKRKRERGKHAGIAYMDGHGKQVDGAELQKQWAERERKMAAVRRQHASMMMMRDSSSSSSGADEEGFQ